MGRYYNGDINGKFWFGVQSSTDASFFGGEQYEPTAVQYYFDSEDLDTINEGIEKCINHLGGYKDKLDAFFKEHNGYNDEMLMKALEVSNEKVRELLEWYARLELGEKIKKCVEEKQECTFEAEL